MTHLAIESSEFDGSPIELFLFQRGTAAYWAYTSSTHTVNVQGIYYLATTMSRSNFEKSQDYRKNNLKLNMPLSTDFVQQYISSPPTDNIDLIVYRCHENDPDQQIVIRWMGRVINVSFGENTVELTCESIETIFNRSTLRRIYGRSCPFYLYDPHSCKVDPDAYAVGATLTAVDGLMLYSSVFDGYEDGYFAGGYLVFQVGSILNKRFILSHVGNSIQINLPFNGLVSNSYVVVRPGCGRTPEHCSSRFNNIVNYGGQPFIPVKNPMNGTLVY